MEIENYKIPVYNVITMKLKALLKSSLNALKINRGRTILTTLGIIIGITAVIAVFSAGESIKKFIEKQIEMFGSDIVWTEPRVPSQKRSVTGEAQGQQESVSWGTETAFSMAQGTTITTLKQEDVEEIKKLENIKDAYGGIMGQEKITFKNKTKTSFVWGLSPSFYKIDKGEIESGRFFTEEENNSQTKVAVLGYKIKEKLFGNQNPLGEDIKVGEKHFKVIGFYKEKGSFSGMNMDDLVYLPLKTAQKQVLGVDHIMFAGAELKNPELSEVTAEQIRQILRRRHNISNPAKDDFETITLKKAMEIIGSVMNAISLLLTSIAAISLMVGGVGIMNIMYVAVSERTKEIGIRKALGASEKNILNQFLLEAVFITLSGGLIGIILGISLSYLISFGAGKLGFIWPFIISLKGILIAFFFAAIVGIVFGYWPARKASLLDPIVAIRKE